MKFDNVGDVSYFGGSLPTVISKSLVETTVIILNLSEGTLFHSYMRKH